MQLDSELPQFACSERSRFLKPSNSTMRVPVVSLAADTLRICASPKTRIFGLSFGENKTALS